MQTVKTNQTQRMRRLTWVFARLTHQVVHCAVSPLVCPAVYLRPISIFYLLNPTKTVQFYHLSYDIECGSTVTQLVEH